MNQKFLIIRGIRFKIIIAIVTCSIFVALLVGGVSIINSRNIVEKQSKEVLLLTAENKTKEFNTTILNVEGSVNHLGDTLSANFKVESIKNDNNYINNFDQSIQDIVKKFGETTKGCMSVYFYENPDLTGGVHGVWYADKKGNKTFEAQPLGVLEDFTPDNKDMAWYYKPIKAHKALWLDPYVDPDLKVSMISYVVPIYQNDTLIGVVGMDINFNYFKQVVSDTKVYKTGYSTLLNANNDILAHPTLKQGDNFAKVENGALKVLTDEFSKNQSGVMDYLYKGVKKVGAYSHLANGDILMINVPQSEVLAEMQNITLIVLVIIAISLFVIFVIAAVLGIVIAKPIIKATEFINKTAKLDLIYDKLFEDLLKNKDETGIMVRALSNMRESLRNIVKDLIQDATATSEYSSILATSTNKSSEAINSVSQSVEELAQGASHQAEITQNGLEKLLNLSKELDVITNSSKFVKEYLDETNKVNKNAILSIEELQDKFKVNNEISREVTSSIYVLANKSDSIGEIINTIKYIAEQTNLLALNASIEAARAGEQGKGFAVVADEIRKLSEQTSLATKEIEKIVNEIQIDINNAKSRMDNSNNISNESNKALLNTNASFEVINNSIKNSFVETTQLINSIEKISQSKNEVVNNIQEISSIIEESAASAEEVSALLENEMSTIEEIFQTSQNLKEIAIKLEGVVKEFKI